MAIWRNLTSKRFVEIVDSKIPIICRNRRFGNIKFSSRGNVPLFHVADYS